MMYDEGILLQDESKVANEKVVSSSRRVCEVSLVRHVHSMLQVTENAVILCRSMWVHSNRAHEPRRPLGSFAAP